MIKLQPKLRAQTIANLLDHAFWIYRMRTGMYLMALAFPFLGLTAFGLGYGGFGGSTFSIAFAILVLGNPLPSVDSPLQYAVHREMLFPDGALFWTISAALLAPMIAHAYLIDPRERSSNSQAMRLNVWVMALVVMIPVMALRWMGAGLLSDFMRLPALFAPYIMVLENTSVRTALGRSWELMKYHLLRVLAVFVLVLLFLRLAAALPFVSLSILNRWILAVPVVQPGTLLPITAFILELLIYPVVHIIVALLYYDLRVRREGFDIALAAAHGDQEVIGIS